MSAVEAGVVDVVIPARARPTLTIAALESVCDQTHTALQIYLVEDGDTALAELQRQIADERLHYTSLHRNQGPSAARNHGAALGKGEFIAFLDNDDRWQPRKLAQQLKCLAEQPGLHWVHTNELWLRNNKEVKQRREHRKQGGQFVGRMFERCLVSPSAVLFRRAFWEQHGGFLPHFRVAEDYELWMRLNFQFPIGYVDEPLTIKQAGDWSQLSATPQIDRNRVLALHRFYRLYHNHDDFAALRLSWAQEIQRKLDYLIKGAARRGRDTGAEKYRSWLLAVSRHANA